jgi:hypothetical protein
MSTSNGRFIGPLRYREQTFLKRPRGKKLKSYYRAKNLKVEDVRTIAKNEIRKKEEIKVSQAYGTLNPICLQAGVASLSQNCYTLTPGSANFTDGCNIIVKGVNQGERIGDEIKVRSVSFRYQINPKPYNATTNPTPEPKVVILYFVSPKVGQAFGTNATSYISNNSTSNFFDSDITTEAGFEGNMADMLKKLDKDNYTVYKIKMHKVYYSGVSGTGSQTAVYGYANNDFKFMAKGKITLGHRNVAYNSSNNNPQIQPVYCIIQVLNADGTTPPASRQGIDFRLNNTIYYTDA